MNYKIFGIILIAIAILVAGAVLFHNSQKRRQSIVFSEKLMLDALWDSYKKHYWDSDSGRTIDRQRNDITTSEGQSYTMLRAVWQDDKATFDKTWQWTQKNLNRPDDRLFSWLYGKQTDGNYAVLVQQGGNNSATDADTDIATALLLASSRWQDQKYAEEAKSIITDIWNNEVVTINNTPYITADNMEKDAPDVALVNPSYYAPYAYRLFAQVDPGHDWNKVVDSSYDILQKSSASNLDKSKSIGLPPDWVAIDKKTGNIKPATTNNMTSNYGFDALRVPFRLALDWQWNQDPRAKSLLESFSFLDKQWQDKGAVYATYSHDGSVVSSHEVPAMYGAGLGYFLVADPAVAKDIYDNKLQNLYSSDTQDWKQLLGYYDDNWAWFGLALYNNSLINYFRPTQARLEAPSLYASGQKQSMQKL